jgi:DNA-binding transcriptional LysR family regulator
MELRHLRYAVAVADELHFARAAARLHISQPPLSQQIRALEDEIGVQLFERTSRRVRLTDAGAAFIAEARRTLASADRATDAARRAARGETGRLAIGYVSSASYELLPAILRGFRRITPDAVLVLEEMSSAEQSRALAAGTLDLGFVRRPPPVERHLAATLVLRESIVLAVPRDHPLARRRAVPLRQLSREAFIIYPVRPRPSWADAALELCRAAGFEPRIVHEALEMVSALSLVAAGIGVALVPAAVRAVRRPGVVFRPLAPAPSTEVLLVRRDEPPAGLIARFLEVVAATRLPRAAGSARR